MNIDSSVLYAVVSEIKNELPARIQKIYQHNYELHIHYRSNNHQNRILIIDIAANPRVYFTTEQKNKKINEKPANFCMVMRKYAEGGVIEQVEQFEFERIVSFAFRKRTEIGDNLISELKIELMGKHSNMILCSDNNSIIDSIKHIHPDMNKFRIILPGVKYSLPPHSDRKNPIEMSENDWINVFEGYNKDYKDIYRYLNEKIMGINPNFEHFLHLSDDNNKFNAQAFYNLFNLIRTQQYSFGIYQNDDNKDFISVFDLTDKSLLLPMITNTHINDLLDEYFSNMQNNAVCTKQKKDLANIIAKNIKNLNKRINDCEKSLSENADFEQYREWAEILLANMHKLSNNLDSISLENFYDKNETIIIKLDPELTPSLNVQKYFKKYNKIKNTIHNSKNLLEKYYMELAYLENIVFSVDEAENVEDLQPMEEELIKGKYIEKKQTKIKAKTSEIQFNIYVYDEITIWAGKNNQQNDYLTLKKADGEDWWFHIKDFPGSHVVVKSKSNNLDDTLLTAAAQIAAVNSKAKNSSNVQIDYTKCKNVKKPKGFPLGLVIYDNYKTIGVNPDINFVNSLRQKN